MTKKTRNIILIGTTIALAGAIVVTSVALGMKRKENKANK